MRVSAYSPQIFNSNDLVSMGNTLLLFTVIAILLFAVIYYLILPFSCLLFPQLDITTASTNPNKKQAISCQDAPEFPTFLFAVFALVLVAYAVHHFELKLPSVK